MKTTVHVISKAALFRGLMRRIFDANEGYGLIAQSANTDLALQHLEKKPELCLIDLDSLTSVDLGVIQSVRHRYNSTLFVGLVSDTLDGEMKAIEAMGMGINNIIALPDASGSDLFEADNIIKTEFLCQLGHFISDTKSKLIGKDVSEKAENIVLRPPDLPSLKWLKHDVRNFNPSLILIGASTGGPSVIEQMVRALEEPPCIPVIVVQHMPADYTRPFASNLAKVTNINIAEAINGEEITSGRILLAPGGFHLELRADQNKIYVSLNDGPPRNFVRPAVDVTLQSVASIKGTHAMAFIMTGLGRDGMQGAMAIKNAGGAVMIQDKESSVVWGMPGATYAAGAYDGIGTVKDCARIFAKMCRSAPYAIKRID